MDFFEFAKILSRAEGERLSGEIQKALLELDDKYMMCAECEIIGTETCITQCAEEMSKC